MYFCLDTILILLSFLTVKFLIRHPRHYGWTLWEGRVAPGEEVWSKAVDSSHNSQPETFENIWNLRGTLSHAYCRYRVKEGNALAG